MLRPSADSRPLRSRPPAPAVKKLLVPEGGYFGSVRYGLAVRAQQRCAEIGYDRYDGDERAAPQVFDRGTARIHHSPVVGPKETLVLVQRRGEETAIPVLVSVRNRGRCSRLLYGRHGGFNT